MGWRLNFVNLFELFNMIIKLLHVCVCQFKPFIFIQNGGVSSEKQWLIDN